MNNLKYIGILPARYASTRFPGKPLAMIGDMTMIERVWRQARKVLDCVYVATDDSRIYDAVKSFGGDVVMTSADHRSGTDRCYEAYTKIGKGEDVIINIQGDEPFIHTEQIREIMSCFDAPDARIATLVRRFDPTKGFDALFDANTPKVVFDKAMNAKYFSRSIIPYVRNFKHTEWLDNAIFHTHVGMYAYRSDVLAEITKLPQSTLEIAESLEQLRWIENGYNIKVATTQYETIGIDTHQDLQRAIALLED